jgi:hypothetical protein
MNIDKSFIHTYDVKILEEIKTGYEIYYYPGASTQGGKDGIIVQVNSKQGKTWIGTFAFGNIRNGGFFGIYTTPHQNRLCIVANGIGYFVDADNPKDWEEVKSMPITDVRVSKSKNILVFADYTKLVAYDSNGVKWKTKQLAWEKLKIKELSDAHIVGEYYDIRSESMESFKVNLSTGDSNGGVE